MLQTFSSIIDFDVQTKSIKGAINPLANQVAIMSSYYNKKKGVKSRKLLHHAKHVNEICYELIKFAREVAKEHPDVEYELNQACNRTCEVYNVMKMKIEGDDKHDSARTIIDIAKQLINNVARILIVTDSADLILIDKTIEEVKKCLKAVEQCIEFCALDEIFQKLRSVMDVLMKQIANRQMDLLDTQKKDELGLVRSMWMRCKERLYTSSRVAIVHPELESGVTNRNLVLQEMNESVKKLQAIIKGRSTSESQSKAGILASCFEEFEVSVIFANKMKREQQALLQNNLAIIIKEASSIADSASTREERQQNIHRLCKDCEMLLNVLIHSNPDCNNDKHIEKICWTTGQLRHYLQLATLDHIDDFYFLPHIPFQWLYSISAEGAKDKDQLRESEHEMVQHVLNLEMIARMACSLSVESYHNKVVRFAIANIANLVRQVVFATRSLANQPKSELIKQNMDVYKKAWSKELNNLVEAVDEITPVNEYLYISISHAKENVELISQILEAEFAYQNENNGGEKNWADLDQTVDALINRTYRVLNVIREERRKVVDERYLSNDPVMGRCHHLAKYTLIETKKLCDEIVKEGKPKKDALKKKSGDVVSQLCKLQIAFSKATTRCDAYIESFYAECDSTEHELNRNSLSIAVDKPLQTCLKICAILKVIVSNVKSGDCIQHWPVVIQKLKELNTETSGLDFCVRDIVTNGRSSAVKADLILEYSGRIVECSRHALNVAMKDMSLYVCYGEVFVSLLSSAKSIISYIPEIYKGCLSSSSKRKKVFKK